MLPFSRVSDQSDVCMKAVGINLLLNQGRKKTRKQAEHH